MAGPARPASTPVTADPAEFVEAASEDAYLALDTRSF
jgi:hypothetical protein